MKGAGTNGRRLVREGIVQSTGDTCTVVKVSVPCGSCRLGGCRSLAGSADRTMNVRTDATLTADASGCTGRFDRLVPGQQVSVSIAAAALTGSCMRLFGPFVVWTVVVAWFAAGPGQRVEALGNLQLAIVLVGWLASLWLGRWLASGFVEELEPIIETVGDLSPARLVRDFDFRK